MAQALCQAALRVAVAPVASLQTPFLGSAKRSVAAFAVSNGSRTAMERPLWLPGTTPPEYLDGSLPCDYGFDPLRFGDVPSNLDRFVEAELIHSRWAMAAAAGIMLPEALGLGNWVSAQDWAAKGGIPTYLGQPVPWGSLPIILAVEAIAIAFVEAKRNEEQDPQKRKYPGGAFDPLGFSKDASKLEVMKKKEIANGRTAMLALLGFAVQAAARPGTGPLENLADHLSSPWTSNIAEVIIPRSIL